jgi:hypothetical protein
MHVPAHLRKPGSTRSAAVKRGRPAVGDICSASAFPRRHLVSDHSKNGALGGAAFTGLCFVRGWPLAPTANWR